MLLKSKFPVMYVFELEELQQSFYKKPKGNHAKDSSIMLYLNQERKYNISQFKKNNSIALKILLNGDIWWIDKKDVEKF
jgi:hypothetical protein